MLLNIQYLGETTWIGQLGHAFVVLGFVAGLLSVFAYYRSFRNDNESWHRTANGAFTVQSISIFSVIGFVLYLLIGKFYEYQYAQSHVSDDLPMRYIFSAFWEGQEGSFL